MSEERQKQRHAAQTVGERVRSFREARGMDRETLAADASLSVEFVERLENGDRTEFTLVGSQEANHKAKPMRLSDESPFGKAVMGHHVDDVVTIEAPAMSFQVKIVSITR